MWLRGTVECAAKMCKRRVMVIDEVAASVAASRNGLCSVLGTVRGRESWRWCDGSGVRGRRWQAMWFDHYI